jgi:hypothetical protein
MVPIIGKLLDFSASKSQFFFTTSDSERNEHRSYPILLGFSCTKSWGQFCCMSLIADELLILISFAHAWVLSMVQFLDSYDPPLRGLQDDLNFVSPRIGEVRAPLNYSCWNCCVFWKIWALPSDIYLGVCVCVTLELVFTHNMSSIASMKGSDCSA